MFIFSRRSQGGLLEIGERKKPQPAGDQTINAKTKRYIFVYIICEKSGWAWQHTSAQS